MTLSKRISAASVATVLALAASALPAGAAGTSWSKAQCQTWEKSFLKRNPHASKVRKGQGNKVLRSHGCSVRIK